MPIASVVAPLVLGASGLWGWATLHRNAPIFGPVLARLPGDAPRVALTFDDGPSPEWTPRVLDALGELGIVATFFLLGRHVARWPAIARRIAAEGHVVANHGFAHRRLDLAGPTRARHDVERGRDVIADATGIVPAYFRAPHGARSPFVTPAARAAGAVTVGWSLGSHDHERPGADAIVHRVARARAGDIILLHDADAYDPAGDRSQTVAALPRIVAALRARPLAFDALPR